MLRFIENVVDISKWGNQLRGIFYFGYHVKVISDILFL